VAGTLVIISDGNTVGNVRRAQDGLLLAYGFITLAVNRLTQIGAGLGHHRAAGQFATVAGEAGARPPTENLTGSYCSKIGMVNPALDRTADTCHQKPSSLCEISKRSSDGSGLKKSSGVESGMVGGYHGPREAATGQFCGCMTQHEKSSSEIRGELSHWTFA
jgi:hypothetical protein